MNQNLNTLERDVTKTSIWHDIHEFLNLHLDVTDKISISILDVFAIVLSIIIAKIFLKVVFRVFTNKMGTHEKAKIEVVFGYFKWLVYTIIFFYTLHMVGVDVTAVMAASAALLIGVGLALQTLFKDIISGIFILVDQSLHVGNIIEINDRIGRVIEIKLRTTRAVTPDNKILIIPNHFYLENTLLNWTQNNYLTRDSVLVGVAYGSDLKLVSELLKQAASSHPDVIQDPEVIVQFLDFGDNALSFKVIFTLADSFMANSLKSDIRYEIDRLFREHNISVPYPQRDIHIVGNSQKQNHD